MFSQNRMNGWDCWGPDTKISQIDFCHIFISYATFVKQCHLMRNDSYEHMHIWKHYAPKKEQTTVDVESEEIWKRKPFIQLRAIVSTGIYAVLRIIDAMNYPCNWNYSTLFVQRTNILPIHCSFPCHTKGLFLSHQFPIKSVLYQKIWKEGQLGYLN